MIQTKKQAKADRSNLNTTVSIRHINDSGVPRRITADPQDTVWAERKRDEERREDRKGLLKLVEPSTYSAE
jgi:hypothetical protein